MTLFAANAFHYVAAGGDGSAQRVFVPGETVDLRPRHSNSSERGTNHVFSVILAQIRSAVPEIFDSQPKTNQKNKKVTDSAKTRTLRSSLRVVLSERTAGRVGEGIWWVTKRVLYKRHLRFKRRKEKPKRPLMTSRML